MNRCGICRTNPLTGLLRYLLVGGGIGYLCHKCGA